MALKANGTVYAWGCNKYGQLGSTGSNSSRPVQVVTGQQGSASGYLEKVVELDAASEADSTWGTSIAVTESKEVYGWGYSGYGALGKTGEFKSPIRVSNIPPLLTLAKNTFTVAYNIIKMNITLTKLTLNSTR